MESVDGSKALKVPVQIKIPIRSLKTEKRREKLAIPSYWFQEYGKIPPP